LTLRSIANARVGAVGLGCMNLSHADGPPTPPDEAEALLLGALELGVTHFDTAALYGFGANETLVGRVLAPHRREFFLASKCGMTGVAGKRVIDGRPETLKRTCEEALARLRTEVIDLYYLHRWDRQVPVEDSVGAMAELVAEGKIRAIGLSEVSAATLRRAHAVHPIAALQTEYSLWTRNPEIAVLDACRELGVAFVAFSPLGRGFLADAIRRPEDVAVLAPRDIRRTMPRFLGEDLAHNLELLPAFRALAAEAGCTPAQLALAWLLAQGEHVLPIPGTRSLAHLQENLAAASLDLPAELLARAGSLIGRASVRGPRYDAEAQADVDTEEF